jgi:tetratricopeptide (TPR) repeat protein
MFRPFRIRRPSAGTAARLLLLACIAGAVLSCASYVNQSTVIRTSLSAGAYDEALDHIAEISGSNSLLLLLYEQGMVLHCKGDYPASNLAFERAERVLDALYTRSVTRELASLAVSETVSQYRGDAYEAVFVNYYKILNYLALGQVEDAMVECRRVNRRLQMFNDGSETYFVNEPFVQYITALVYTRGREYGDAEVSYRVATGLFADPDFEATAPPPPFLYCDAAALARALGDRDEADAYAARATCPTGELGRVNLLLDCGQIAQKGEASAVIPIFESDRWNDDEEFAHELSKRHGRSYGRSVRVKYWLRFSLPTLVPQPPRYNRVVVRARPADPRTGTELEVSAPLVENLDAHALRAFEEKQSTVLVRAIARALVKYAAFDAADNKDPGLGAVVNLFNAVTETADTRNWSTLPQTIHMARLDLPPGEYTIDADFLSPDGVKRGTVTFSGVRVVRGGVVFRNARVF